MSAKAIDIGGDHVAGISRPILSVAPVSLPVEGRGAALQLRISAPLDGAALPIILFSHGNGQSLYAYSLVMLLSPATATLAARTVEGSAWAI